MSTKTPADGVGLENRNAEMPNRLRRAMILALATASGLYFGGGAAALWSQGAADIAAGGRSHLGGIIWAVGMALIAPTCGVVAFVLKRRGTGALRVPYQWGMFAASVVGLPLVVLRFIAGGGL